MKSGWKELSLSELEHKGCFFKDGNWIESKDQDPDGDIKLVQLADIGELKLLNCSNRFMTKESAYNLKCSFLEKGDLLIARMPEPLGRSCIFDLEGKEKFVTVVDVAIFRNRMPDLDSKYLAYCINSPLIRTKIFDLQSGSTRKRISRRNLGSIKFRVAPYPDQKKIVTKLDALFAEIDAGIVEIKDLKKQLELYKQSVLHATFGVLKVACETIDFKKVCAINYGKALPERDRICGISKVYGSSGEVGSHDKSLNTTPIIVVGRKGNISGVFKVDGPSWVIDTAYAIIPISTLTRDYLYYFLKHNSLQFISQDQSTAVPSLSREILYSLKVNVPTLDVQNIIVKRLDSLFFETNLLIEKIEQAEESLNLLKQSILKQAFEGNLV